MGTCSLPWSFSDPMLPCSGPISCYVWPPNHAWASHGSFSPSFKSPFKCHLLKGLSWLPALLLCWLPRILPCFIFFILCSHFVAVFIDVFPFSLLSPPAPYPPNISSLKAKFHLFCFHSIPRSGTVTERMDGWLSEGIKEQMHECLRRCRLSLRLSQEGDPFTTLLISPASWEDDLYFCE